MYNMQCQTQTQLQQIISKNYRSDEKECVHNLLQILKITKDTEDNAIILAKKLITNVRAKRVKGLGVDAIMNEFKLSTDEGIALMCLAESLLRIPDKKTQNELIKDKIALGNWKNYTKTENTFINAASWGLLITGKLTKPKDSNKLSNALLKVITSGGEPLIRKAIVTAVHFMGSQFVMGETIEKALEASKAKEDQGYQFSYDMLGEAAMTDEDALKYMQSYIDAIHKVGKFNAKRGVIYGPGISVKLSAIHPRYLRSKHDQVMLELYPRLKQLFLLAKEYQIALFIDAEETERLEISLDLLQKLLNDEDLKDFKGIGFVIQAYQKRAIYVIDYVVELAKQANNKLMVRLVKGAYWDSEIKKAQVDGQIDYPVFTRKFYTDLSYLACAQKLLAHQSEIYPLFATHNAYTFAIVYELAKGKEFEFQCLYGMGETLYDNIVGINNLNVTCRVYAPVGTYQTLLAYLVRRLLENGANSSFVHQLVDKNIPIEDLLISPIELSLKANGASNPNFTSPLYIYSNDRVNSKGLDLSDEITLRQLQDSLSALQNKEYTAHSLISGMQKSATDPKMVFNPANKDELVGKFTTSELTDVSIAITNAENSFKEWSQQSNNIRADILLQVANLLEKNMIELIGLLVREAGKTINNAINEIREAVDFCRYYAIQAKTEFNSTSYEALGTLVCISPWNFPLAIFIGEISSCLVMGNCVIAKPSIQTNLIAFYAVKLFHEAGVPEDVLQLIIGSGSVIGNALTLDNSIKGVIFTGSTQTAQLINKNLAEKSFDSVLIAETGGQNTMIVDSTALPEQVVMDVVTSGFDSAGQRCSALRVLYLQAEIADKIIHMLKGAMDELIVGNPMNLSTDVGPVIDTSAQNVLLKHIDKMKHQARQIYQAKLTKECANGIFVAPTLIEIGNINELESEVFGPVIHIIRFGNDQLENVIAEINSSGYGLTQGVHSRITETAALVYENINTGNVYVNRNMVGAVVGVQPFGGEGLSGTGPKAGGPLYLYRLVKCKINPQLGTLDQNMRFNEVNDFLVKLTPQNFTQEEQEMLTFYAKDIIEQVLFMRRIDLQGPTGEHNFMLFDKRGFIGCFANNKLDYAKQIICAFATGNQVILPYELNTKVFNKLLPNKIYFCENIDNVEKLNAVLISKDYSDISNLRKSLAKRNGLLVVNIMEHDTGDYPLYLLTTERSVSINITATGGNVQLMNIVDNSIGL